MTSSAPANNQNTHGSSANEVIRLSPPPRQTFGIDAINAVGFSLTPPPPQTHRRLPGPVLISTASTASSTEVTPGTIVDVSDVTAAAEASAVTIPSFQTQSSEGHTAIDAQATAEEIVASNPSAIVVVHAPDRIVRLENDVIAIRVINDAMGQKSIIISAVLSLASSIACILFALWAPSDSEWKAQTWISASLSSLIAFWWVNGNAMIQPQSRKPFLGRWFLLDCIVRLALAISATQLSSEDDAHSRLVTQHWHDFTSQWSVAWSCIVMLWLGTGCIW